MLHVEEIYEECDYITIHVPLMDATRGMVGKEAIDRMKDGVILRKLRDHIGLVLMEDRHTSRLRTDAHIALRIIDAVDDIAVFQIIL